MNGSLYRTTAVPCDFLVRTVPPNIEGIHAIKQAKPDMGKNRKSNRALSVRCDERSMGPVKA
jgi:hypothetical protein